MWYKWNCRSGCGETWFTESKYKHKIMVCPKCKNKETPEYLGKYEITEKKVTGFSI